MPLREAIAWSSSHPDFIQGADTATVQQFLDAALAAFESIAPNDWMENKSLTVEDVLCRTCIKAVKAMEVNG